MIAAVFLVAAALAATPSPTPAVQRPCAPLIVGGIRCGQLCRYPKRGWAVKGCRPLSAALRRHHR